MAARARADPSAEVFRVDRKRIQRKVWAVIQMNNLPCSLISESGEQFDFDSAVEASFFLCRTKGYVASCTAKGIPLSHGKTGEYFKFKCDESKRNTLAHVRKRVQLCCYCKNFAGGCSWSRRFQPVEGWTATRTLINHGRNGEKDRITESYLITKCPEYVKG